MVPNKSVQKQELTFSVLQVDPDRTGRHDAPLSLGTRVKFRAETRRVRLKTELKSSLAKILSVFYLFFIHCLLCV